MDPGQNNYFADRMSGVAGIATEAVTYMAHRVTSTFKNGKFSQELYGKWLADTKTTTTTAPADAGRPATTPVDDQARDSNQSAAETKRLANANKSTPVPRPDGITNLANTSLQAAKNEVVSGRIGVDQAKAVLENGSARDIQALGGRAYLQSIIDGTTNATGTPKPPQLIAKEF